MATRYWIGTDTGNEGEFNTAANWSGGSVPVSGDTIIFENSTQSLTSDLDQSTKRLDIIIRPTFTGAIGTASAYLQVGNGSGSQTWTIGQPTGLGNGTHSGRIKLDAGGTATTINVYGTASASTDTLLEPVRVKGSSITALNVYAGTVGVATTNSTEAATVTTIRLSRAQGSSSGPVVNCGLGCTLTNASVTGGQLSINSAIADVEVAGDGMLVTNGSGGITTEVRINSTTAQVRHNSSGTIAAAYVRGVLDFRGDARAKTVTTCNLYQGATLYADNASPSTVTFTNGVDVKYPASLADVTIYGRGFDVTVEAS